MMNKSAACGRRQFLKGAALLAAGVPFYVPGKLLGRDGAVPPSEKIILGALGIGGRGGDVLRVFMSNPDVRFVAICDTRKQRREELKNMADQFYNNTDCAMYRDMHEFYAEQTKMDAVLIEIGRAHV